MNDSSPQRCQTSVRRFLGVWIVSCVILSGCVTGRSMQRPANQAESPQVAISSKQNATGTQKPAGPQSQATGATGIQTVGYQEPVSEMPPLAPAAMGNSTSDPMYQQPMDGQADGVYQDGWIQPAMPVRDQMSSQRIPSYQTGQGFTQPPPPLPMGHSNGWDQGPSWRDQMGSGPNRNRGVNVVGSEFRIPNPTATELMIGLKDENETLKEKIVGLKTEIKGLNQVVADERKARFLVEENLAEKVRQEQKLRKFIASLQVKLEDLEAEKTATKQQFDQALREIESNLDAALLNSMSGPSDESLSSGRHP